MEGLRVAVLGPLAATRNGVAVPLGGARQRAVLAVLLSADGGAVPAMRLLADVWADDPDAGSRSTLAAYVSRLRRLLREADLTGSSASTYALSLPPGCRDDHEVNSLLLRAEQARRAGRHDQALDACRLALALWRGEPYAGTGCPAVVRERERLHDLRGTVMEEAAAARLALGDAAQVVVDLEPLSTGTPPRAGAVRLRALALAACGQQPQALALLRAASGQVPPGALPALRELERQLLTAATPLPVAPEPGGFASRPSAGPLPAPGALSRPGTAPLPLPLSTFVGREADLAALRATVGGYRLVTLVGSGGAGKTRLVLELLRSEPRDDVAWVALAPLSDSALVEEAFTHAVAAPLDGARRKAPALVAVDNAEHLRAETARCVAQLLDRESDVRVIVTSREPLGLPGERVVDVLPLQVEGSPGEDGPAVHLFVDRVRQVAPDWEGSVADLDAARRICHRLDGLPLAVELAAAQCQALAPVHVADALSDRFALLVGQGPLAVGHHRTLERAIAWSYDMLAPGAQAAFRALAVFVGGFDLGGARWVLGDDAPVLLAELGSRSMLAVDRTRRPRRYSLLESPREFALARWSERERAELPERHAAWAADLARRAEPELLRDDAASWLRLLDLDLPNLRTAVLADIEAGRFERAVAMTADLSWFWYRRKHVADGTALQQAAAAVAPPGRDRVRLLTASCHLTTLRGDLQAALATARQAVSEADAVGCSSLEADTQSTLGWMLALTGDIPAAREHVRRGRAAAAVSGNPVAEADSALAAAHVAYLSRDLTHAALLVEETAVLADQGHHGWCASQAAWLRAKTSLGRRQPRAAAIRAAALVTRAHSQENAVLTLAGVLLLAVSAAQLGHGHAAGQLLGAVLSRVHDRLAEIDPLDGRAYREAVVAAISQTELRVALEQGAQWDEATMLDQVRRVASRLQNTVASP